MQYSPRTSRQLKELPLHCSRHYARHTAQQRVPWCCCQHPVHHMQRVLPACIVVFNSQQHCRIVAVVCVQLVYGLEALHVHVCVYATQLLQQV